MSTDSGNKGFGSKVIGEEAAAKAIESAKGGGEVFGKRVVGDIPEPSGFDIAKKNSEFGARVANDVRAADHRGSTADGGLPSVKELENILEENPTFFDNLYEGELAAAAGPRKAALEVFALVENGIKGQGRPSVLAEINRLLGKNAVTQKQRADHFRAQSRLLADMAQRTEENAQLADAPRIQALVDRENNLESLSKSTRASTKKQVISADTDAQIRQISERDGLEQPNAATKEAGKQEGGGRGAHADLAETDVKPESSSRAPRKSQKRKGARRKSAAKKTATAAK